jgi:hypothetical protein
MTEQEWLEQQADHWMRGPDITPAFIPDLPPVSECGWRVILEAGAIRSARSPLERIRAAEQVEFYAVFDGREVTTRRPANGMNWSVPAWNR